MSQFPDPNQPAPFASMPGYPPPRKSRWWLWLLLGLGGVGVVICCGCAGLAYFGVSAVGGVLDSTMISRLNGDMTAQENLGTVSSATWDKMATKNNKEGKPEFLFHVTGDKGKGDVRADQAPGEKLFENARLIMEGTTDEIPLGF